MTRKSRSATLLAAIAALSLATGTAFAASDSGNGATGYVYPNFWGQTSAEQPSSATAAHQGDGSVGIFITHNGRETTSLFPPNPNW
jgi:hypothetical protein